MVNVVALRDIDRYYCRKEVFNMKKLIVLAIIAVMLVFMTGCSNEKPSMENHYDTTIEEYWRRT